MWALTLAAVVICTYAYGSLVGWAVHRWFHHRSSGPVYRSHMVHHFKLYPPSDYQSDEYRGAGRDNSTLYFVPVVGAVVAATSAALYACGLPAWALCVFLAESAAIGLANSYVHDAFHLRGHWLGRYAWFRRLNELHYAHHVDVRANLGIFSFLADRLLGTYRGPRV